MGTPRSREAPGFERLRAAFATLRSQPGGLGEIDPKAVAFPLIAAGHFGAGVAKVFLHMRLFDLRRGGEAGAQGMAAEGAFSFALGQIAANPRRAARSFLDESGDMLVGQPFGGDAAVFARDRPEEGPVADPAEPHPGLEQRDGAGVGARAAADLDLAPAGLAGDLQQHAAVVVRILAGRIDLDPAGSRPRSGRGRNRGRRSRSGAAPRRSRAPEWRGRAGRAGPSRAWRAWPRARRRRSPPFEPADARACGGCRRARWRCDGRWRRAVSRAGGSASRSRRGGARASQRWRRPRPARRDRGRRSAARAAVRRNRCGAARRRTAASRNHRRARCFRLRAARA